MPYVIKPHRKGDGFVINGSSGEILSKYDLVFLRGGRWYKANASVVDTLPALGLALNEFPTVEYRGLILLYGLVSNFAWTWNDGPIYASTTSGNMTQTAPSAEGWLQFVGVAYGKDYMLFSPMWIKDIGARAQEKTKLDNIEFTLKVPTDEVLDDIAEAGDQTTTEKTLTIALPVGAIIRQVVVSAFLTIMNDTFTAHKIGVTLQGRVAAGAWNNYWSRNDCVGFPAVEAATTGLVAVSDISDLVTVAGDYGFRLTVNQSGGANSVHYTTQYLVTVTYQLP